MTKEKISWQIGFAYEARRRYKKLGLSEMEHWATGRLSVFLEITKQVGFDARAALDAVNMMGGIPA